jgi:hypothetical protein
MLMMRLEEAKNPREVDGDDEEEKADISKYRIKSLAIINFYDFV